MSTQLYPGRCVLYAPGAVPRSFAAPNVCCTPMSAAMTNDCEQHDNPFECPDVFVSYAPAFNEYGLMIRDGTGSSVLISYCPWCGTKLPESLRDAWFDELEDNGIEADLFSDDIPEPYKSTDWWQKTR